MTDKLHLWILSEERPKPTVIKEILKLYAEEREVDYNPSGSVEILPTFKDGHFQFVYEIQTDCIEIPVSLKIVSGSGSFVDFLVFETFGPAPTPSDSLALIIEETKTTDAESRNTGVLQRLSKFVTTDSMLDPAKKVMLYNLQVEDGANPTNTNKFGTRLLLTMDVQTVGKSPLKNPLKRFSSVEELIEEKNSMKRPPKGNVPILLTQKSDSIYISGRLFKSGSLAHDPNIGALSGIAKSLRNLGWTGSIIITRHGLKQKHLTGGSKFVRIANDIGIKLQGLSMPESILPDDYWRDEKNSEKLASIFLHILTLQDNNLRAIYENHAGCERGYLYTEDGTATVVPKYIGGEKSRGKINIPDLVIADPAKKQIYLLEGKKTKNLKVGKKQLKGYGAFEKEIGKLYPDFKFSRGVVLYGPHVDDPEVFFSLDEEGLVTLNAKVPLMKKIQKVLEKFSG